MTGPEHYREAERMLVHTDYSVRDRYDDGAECARQQLAAAQVHATLALAAATALNDADGGMGQLDYYAWYNAASVGKPIKEEQS